MAEICSCDTENPFSDCCHPVITGTKPAESAVELMRARYTAFVKCEVDFIMRSIAPDKRGDYDKKSIEKWSTTTDWSGLEIVSPGNPGTDGQTDEVEFIAFFREKDSVKKHHELATFKKIQGEWFFEDGRQAGIKQVTRQEPKIGRNDPCHCGSGKKYKKCHGKA